MAVEVLYSGIELQETECVAELESREAAEYLGYYFVIQFIGPELAPVIAGHDLDKVVRDKLF